MAVRGLLAASMLYVSAAEGPATTTTSQADTTISEARICPLWKGGIINGATARRYSSPTYEACAAKCQIKSDCQSWSWVRTDNTKECYHKKVSIGNAGNDPDQRVRWKEPGNSAERYAANKACNEMCKCTNGNKSKTAVCSGKVDGSEWCEKCDEWHHLVNTPDGERRCEANECTCQFGTGVIGQGCADDQSPLCASCDDGYHLNEGMCEENECTCENGQGASGTKCANHSTEFCASCNNDNDYHLNTIDGQSVCVQGQTLWDFLERGNMFTLASSQWVKFQVISAAGSSSDEGFYWRTEQDSMYIALQSTTESTRLYVGSTYTMQWLETHGRLILYTDALWEGGEPVLDDEGYIKEFGGRYRIERGSEDKFEESRQIMLMMKNVKVRGIYGAQVHRCDCVNGKPEWAHVSVCANGDVCASCNEGYNLNDQKICEDQNYIAIGQPQIPDHWIVGNEDQSCGQVCEARGWTCDDDSLAENSLAETKMWESWVIQAITWRRIGNLCDRKNKEPDDNSAPWYNPNSNECAMPDVATMGVTSTCDALPPSGNRRMCSCRSVAEDTSNVDEDNQVTNGKEYDGCYNAGYLGGFDADSARQCMIKCFQGYSNTKSYTFPAPTDKSCRCNSEPITESNLVPTSSESAWQNSTSGNIFRVQEFGGECVLRGGFFMNHEIGSQWGYPTDSWSECAQKCETVNGCESWIWDEQGVMNLHLGVLTNEEGPRCWLKRFGIEQGLRWSRGQAWIARSGLYAADKTCKAHLEGGGRRLQSGALRGSSAPR